MNSIKSFPLSYYHIKRGQNLEQSTQKGGKTNHSAQNGSVPPFFFISVELETGCSFIGCQLPPHCSRQTETWKEVKAWKGTFLYWEVREAHPDVLGEAWERETMERRGERERERGMESAWYEWGFSNTISMGGFLLLKCAHVWGVFFKYEDVCVRQSILCVCVYRWVSGGSARNTVQTRYRYRFFFFFLSKCCQNSWSDGLSLQNISQIR